MCICLYSCNDNFSINLGLSKGGATSWLLKSTSATTLTMWNNRERSPGDASLPPDLMNIYSEKMAGKKSGKNWLQYSCPGLSSMWVRIRWSLVFYFLFCDGRDEHDKKRSAMHKGFVLLLCKWIKYTHRILAFQLILNTEFCILGMNSCIQWMHSLVQGTAVGTCVI